MLEGKKAQSTLEYVVILVGIVIAVMAAKTLIGNKVQKMGEDAGATIDKATTNFVSTLDGYGER
ncbi:MAG: hypothetical protein NC936_03185 [Candidatus Omnitrophica bacterium]|nr:hypothetical protein [Candidatus Omnitrophota bacterium]